MKKMKKRLIAVMLAAVMLLGGSSLAGAAPLQEAPEESGGLISLDDDTAEGAVTPAPSATPTPDVTPAPSATPTPDATPAPSATPTPDITPAAPSATPSPEPTPSLEEAALSQTEMTLKLGERGQLTVNWAGGTPEETWSSADPDTASVTENGEVTGTAVGETTVSVLISDGSGAQRELTCRVKVEAEKPAVSYRAHVSKIGWQSSVSNGSMAGTTGQKLPMEALEVSVSGVNGLGIEYRVYISGKGWQNYVSNGSMAGTTGQKLMTEAVQIRLTGEKAEYYDVYYSAHVDKLGWLDWASNDQQAGTLGYNYSLQAVKIQILPKGSAAPGKTDQPFRSELRITAQAHVSKKGWMASTEGTGAEIGTTGQRLDLEAFRLSTNKLYGIGIEYSAHVSKIGWQGYVSNGAEAGTTGRKLPVEAIRIRLTGAEAGQFDVYYRVHVAKFGWLGWAKNDEIAGTTGLACGVQALEVRIVPRGGAAPGSAANAYISPKVQYRAHVSKIGWQGSVANGTIAGTTGRKLPMEALEMSVSGIDGLKIQYRAHVSKIGWQDYVSNGATAGTTGQKLGMEAVQISLTGTGSQYLDIWYRVHSDKVGWLGWTKNGAIAGTTGYKYSAQAVQVVIKLKGSAAPGSTANSYLKNDGGWFYQDGYRRYRDQSGKVLNDVSSLFNPSSKYITVDRTRGLVTIYGYNVATGSYDTPIKAMICSVGNPISLTRAGTYNIGWQLTKKQMVGSDYVCWAPYVSQIYGLVYFHGVASGSPSLQQVSRDDFNALGSPRSHGCVRLAACDAKWIYYNVKSGTTVKIGDGMPAPMAGTRYPWVGGALGPDPTYS